MSTSVLDKLTEAQATVLDTIDQARVPAVGMVERVVTVADRFAPDLSANRTGVVPTVGNVLDNQIAFAIELLKRQRTITKAMVKAAAKSPKATSAKASTAKNGATKAGTTNASATKTGSTKAGSTRSGSTRSAA
jgi:hypothetical protein